MLKKRIIILFLTLFLFKAFANTNQNLLSSKIIEDQEKSKPENFFSTGTLTLLNNKIPFEIYIEKNQYFSNLSIHIQDSTLKSKTEEFEDFFQSDNNKIDGSNKIGTTNIPLELLNYPLRQRDYTILEKSIVYKFKNLKSNKILITNKIVEIPEIIETEVVEPVDNIEEQNIDTETEAVEEIDTTNNDVEEMELVNTIEIDNKYKKLIYIVAEGSNIVLRKEFYLDEDDRDPKYIYEVESIKYIDGYYIPNEWSITEETTKTRALFLYNTDTITYVEKMIPNQYENMTSFNGVR